MDDLEGNYLAVAGRIRAACARAGRDPAGVRLIWVSKNHPRERVVEALALGARHFGENRVQEAMEKFPLPGAPLGHELHFIGRLQKNKIRKVLPLATTLHSIDSLELLEAVDRIAGEMGVRRNVFLQVNTSRERAKGGFEPEALLPALAGLPPLPHLRIVGLMTMGPLETASGAPAGPEEARACFRELKRLLGAARDQAARLGAAGGGSGPGGALKDMAWLSMGMSGDFEVAIEEGA
ncbi:MAG TPA: YggS family pyridoxal phosphate-dependent enzyme, partial [Fibrobacteria bacterium]|nr:YggS family pyridoxal phosphate-dependent enzyme [Fibrobacteria bacterium]